MNCSRPAMSLRTGLLAVSAVALSVAWIYLAVEKIASFEAFAKVVKDQRLAESIGVPSTVAAVGWIASELFTGISGVFAVLVAPRRAGGVLALGAAVLGIVTAYAVMLWQHPPPAGTPCGCGFSSAPVGDWSVVAARNAVLFAVAALAAVYAHRKQKGAGTHTRIEHV